MQNESSDDMGVVAELIQCTLNECMGDLLSVFNGVFVNGNVPPQWSTTHFIMLPKSVRASITSDFKPIVRWG